MWTVIYIAPNKSIAERLKEILTNEGILVRLRGNLTDENEKGVIEVLVPEGEVEEASEVLTNILG